ncbi:MAG: 2-C-methyl-D-erythritol 4-phosphate cytidylyltransferase [Clostridia bacterium]|nr:2-C-methyl-D-erythritol 4-phosphate cytidylyltransferase [Clostridia bacterium]
MTEENRSILKQGAEALKEACGKLKNRFTTAIIVAAGESTRMGGPVPKQFLPICGMPAVVHALKAYNASAYIDSIVAVVRKEDTDLYREYADSFGIDKLKIITEGGETRQDSVLKGVEAIEHDAVLGKKTAYIAIADGARPLTTPQMIDSVCLAAYRFGAATAASRSADTVKTVGVKGGERDFISSTVERDEVRLVTTPQVFSLNIYRAAAYSAMEAGFTGTDDNSLVERIERPVKVVDVGRFNIKLTEPDDLIIAEALMKKRLAEASQCE